MALSEKRKQAIRRGISDVMSQMRARVWDRMYEQSLASEQMTYDHIRWVNAQINASIREVQDAAVKAAEGKAD